MRDPNKELSAEDKEQIEYINEWLEKKEKKKQQKMQNRSIRQFYLELAKRNFKAGINMIIAYLKCIKK